MTTRRIPCDWKYVKFERDASELLIDPLDVEKLWRFLEGMEWPDIASALDIVESFSDRREGLEAYIKMRERRVPHDYICTYRPGHLADDPAVVFGVIYLFQRGVPAEYGESLYFTHELTDIPLLYKSNVPLDYAEACQRAGLSPIQTVAAWASALPVEYATATA